MPLLLPTPANDARALLADAIGAIVMVPVYNSPDDVALCLQALLRHTDPAYTLLFVDDGSPDATAVDSVRAVGDDTPHRVVLYARPVNLGFVGTCNEAFDICAGHDVVLLNSDVVVAAEWLPRLLAAAASSNTIATVSTLTNHGTIVSLPARNEPGPLPEGLCVDEAARRVAAMAKRTYPVLPTGVGHCLLVTRAALDAVGGFDTIFAPGYGEEVDFCQRAACRGFINVLADDVFVYHKGASSFGVSPAKLQMQADHERIVNQRYPNYAQSVVWAATSNRSALAAALAVARRALVGTRVAVDGMCLGEQLMGTQRFVVETAIALAEQPDVAETHLFVPEEVPEYVVRATLDHPRLKVHPLPGHVLHDDHYDAAVRPYQVDHVVQLQWMRHMADVAVVTQLDLIAYHNPAYFGSPAAWKAYREVTEFTFDTVDGVAFISEHSLAEAAREGLLNDHHQRAVTYCGLDHRSGVDTGVRPVSSPPLRDDGFLLVLGASYLHKNRTFALQLWGMLREGGYTGQLALVGATPPNGNTLAEEDRWLAAHTELADDVVRLGSIGEAEKAWLLAHAQLVLYPTLSEGFGMVPFEAAHAGTPVLTTRQGALLEVLPAELECAPTLVPADSLQLAGRLLDDPEFRAAQVALLCAAADRFTWRASAAELVRLVARTLDAPAGRRSVGTPPSMVVHRSRIVDGVVRAVHRLPGFHRIVVGTGTRRQRALRRAANWLRRRIK
ncbi:MAG: glycosyltransferase [Actinomycetota bacterium]|nr:glycosyltransferase [Actinomycetota bacterium]